MKHVQHESGYTAIIKKCQCFEGFCSGIFYSQIGWKKSTTEFRQKYEPNENCNIKWSILRETKHITKDAMGHLNSFRVKADYKINKPWDRDAAKKDYSQVYCCHFLPSLERHL